MNLTNVSYHSQQYNYILLDVPYCILTKSLNIILGTQLFNSLPLKQKYISLKTFKVKVCNCFFVNPIYSVSEFNKIKLNTII